MHNKHHPSGQSESSTKTTFQVPVNQNLVPGKNYISIPSWSKPKSAHIKIHPLCRNCFCPVHGGERKLHEHENPWQKQRDNRLRPEKRYKKQTSQDSICEHRKIWCDRGQVIEACSSTSEPGLGVVVFVCSFPGTYFRSQKKKKKKKESVVVLLFCYLI